MAIVLNSNPGTYYSAHGDLIFVVYEAVKAVDPITYPDYKYVCDVYIGATLVARIKKFPQPDNKRGVFPVGDIIRGYVSAIFNPVSTTLRSQELGLGEFFINATMKFGEEYSFTLTSNLTVDAARKYFNHYNGRLIGQNTTLEDYLDKVVSVRPYAIGINLADNFTFIPYFPSTTNPITITVIKYGQIVPASAVTIEWGYSASDPYDGDLTNTVFQFAGSYASGVNTFDLNFTLDDKYLIVKEPATQPVKTDWSNTAFNFGTFPDSVFREPEIAGGYRYYVSRIPVVLDDTTYSITFSNGNPNPVTIGVSTGTYTADITPSAALTLQIFNVSPGLLNILTPGFIDSDVTYYTVQFGATSLYRFDMVCEPRYEIHRLHFLNRFGGFETRNFSKVSRKNLKIDKADFGKLPYTIDSNGAVSYHNANNVYNETTSVYSSQYSEKLTLNTDILSDEEYAWLQDLILSPLVYIEQEGYFISIGITANNYELKKQINDKLTNLTIDIEFGDKLNTQFR